MKRLIAALLAVTIISTAWISTSIHINAPTGEGEATRYVAIAEKQCAGGAYGSAIRLYQRALSKEDNVALRLRLAEIWRLYGNKSGYRNELKELIRAYPKEPRAYELLAGSYYSNSEFTKCCALVERAKTAGVESEVLDEIYRNCAYQYKVLTGEFDYAGVFVDGYALVQQGKKYFIVNSDLKYVTNNGFDFSDLFHGSSAAVKAGGECYFIDKSGEKYMVVDAVYTSLYSYSEGLAVVECNGWFGYIDIFGDLTLGIYDFASTFSCGIAAIYEGNGWRLIDKEGNYLINTRFDNIRLDENNTVGSGEFCFVEEAGCWYIVDTKTWKVRNTEFEDARVPTEDNMAAVKQNGLWGFTDKYGNLIIEPIFEDAVSFSCGLAAVKLDGVWGYIDMKGNTVIDCVFENANQFSNNGLAPVKIDGKWTYIKLKYRENMK